jgi:hypothetical protein
VLIKCFLIKALLKGQDNFMLTLALSCTLEQLSLHKPCPTKLKVIFISGYSRGRYGTLAMKKVVLSIDERAT